MLLRPARPVKHHLDPAGRRAGHCPAARRNGSRFARTDACE